MHSMDFIPIHAAYESLVRRATLVFYVQARCFSADVPANTPELGWVVAGLSVPNPSSRLEPFARSATTTHHLEACHKTSRRSPNLHDLRPQPSRGQSLALSSNAVPQQAHSPPDYAILSLNFPIWARAFHHG